MKSVLYVFLAISASSCSQTNDAATHLKQTTECMLKVLKTVPGVSEPRLGTVTSAGSSHPFLEYRAMEGSRWIQPTRFTFQESSEGPGYFMATLPGIGPIDIHVTDIIVKKWKTTCGARALVLTV